MMPLVRRASVHAGRWVAVSLLSALIGAMVGYYFNGWMTRGEHEDTTARWAVASMLQRCPVKDSTELEARKDTYLAALRRAKKDGRGVPVWREDCTIGAHYTVPLGDTLRLNGWLR